LAAWAESTVRQLWRPALDNGESHQHASAANLRGLLCAQQATMLPPAKYGNELPPTYCSDPHALHPFTKTFAWSIQPNVTR
jgi:hypothetical protein